MAESKLQVAYTSWWPVALPEIKSWHVYNENSVNAIQGKIKKDRGVLAGVHDNHILYGWQKFATLELKDPDKPASQNKYSPKQKEFALFMDKCGFPHACCQNGEQIETFFISLGLKPLFRFPVALECTKRLMTQQVVMDALYRR